MWRGGGPWQHLGLQTLHWRCAGAHCHCAMQALQVPLLQVLQLLQLLRLLPTRQPQRALALQASPTGRLQGGSGFRQWQRRQRCSCSQQRSLRCSQ
jgi:hypothetical protein